MINAIILIYLIIIWLISSQILCQAFTGILLNSYFNIKSTPVVNTLQDIRDNKQLLIGGHFPYLQYISNISKFHIDDILARMQQDTKRLPRVRDSIEYIINGKGIVLYNTLVKRNYIEIVKFYKEKIYISENKYLPEIASFFIKRNQNFTKIVEF